MKLSIIVPSYNSSRFIRETLDSILNDQDSVPIELIVVDGGSTDNTLDILRSYGNKLRWISERDNGEPDAINKGMAMATGDVLAYIDADDVYYPYALKKVAKYFNEHPEAMWLYGKGRIIDIDGRYCRSLITKFKEVWQPHYSYDNLRIVDFIVQPTAFWRGELVKEIGGFPVKEHLAFEYDFWLRAGRKYKPAFLNEYLACWRSHPASVTAKDIYANMADALRLSGKYTGWRLDLRLAELGIYLLAIGGYFVIGLLNRGKGK